MGRGGDFRSFRKHLVHEPKTIGDLAHLSLGRDCRSPEAIVCVVVRQCEGVGKRTAKFVVPLPEAPVT
jgi:hypothetical protein